MSYLDFIIRKESKSLRNVISKTELNQSTPLESLNPYRKTFNKFLKIYKFFWRTVWKCSGF